MLVEEMQRRVPLEAMSSFSIIGENQYFCRSMGDENVMKSGVNEVFPCECRPIYFSKNTVEKENPARWACGELSNCVNRAIYVECHPEECPCREECQNQRMIRKNYADVEVFDTKTSKGFGLRCREGLPRNTLVMEYVGEVLDQHSFEDRIEKYKKRGQKHYYFMTLQNDRIIDATDRGNLSRFMNHSCNPNCETQKWISSGQQRIGLFTKHSVRPGTELTFDYKFVRLSNDDAPVTCLCMESNCKSVIGEKSMAEKEFSPTYVNLSLIDGPIKNSQEAVNVAKSLLTAETSDVVVKLINRLRLTDSKLALESFLAAHGFQVLSIILGLYGSEVDLVSKVLEIIVILVPMSLSIQAIDDSKIVAKIRNVLLLNPKNLHIKKSCENIFELIENLTNESCISKEKCPSTVSENDSSPLCSAEFGFENHSDTSKLIEITASNEILSHKMSIKKTSKQKIPYQNSLLTKKATVGYSLVPEDSDITDSSLKQRHGPDQFQNQNYLFDRPSALDIESRFETKTANKFEKDSRIFKTFSTIKSKRDHESNSKNELTPLFNGKLDDQYLPKRKNEPNSLGPYENEEVNFSKISGSMNFDRNRSKTSKHYQRHDRQNNQPHRHDQRRYHQQSLRQFSNDQKVDENPTLQPGWKSSVDLNGRIYYYHEVTRESCWDPPLLNHSLDRSSLYSDDRILASRKLKKTAPQKNMKFPQSLNYGGEADELFTNLKAQSESSHVSKVLTPAIPNGLSTFTESNGQIRGSNFEDDQMRQSNNPKLPSSDDKKTVD